MQFNSLEYLIFLPLVIAAYFALPHRLRWVLLLSADVYAGRGIAFADKGDFARVIKDYQKALTLSPESGMVHFNRARACHQLGRIAEAIAAYREFIKYAPAQYTQYIEPVKTQIAVLEGSLPTALTDRSGRTGS